MRNKEEEKEIIVVENGPSESSSTNPSSKHKKVRKLYDTAIPIDVKRVKEEKDVLKLSENSSIQLPKEKEEL